MSEPHRSVMEKMNETFNKNNDKDNFVREIPGLVLNTDEIVKNIKILGDSIYQETDNLDGKIIDYVVAFFKQINLHQKKSGKFSVIKKINKEDKKFHYVDFSKNYNHQKLHEIESYFGKVLTQNIINYFTNINSIISNLYNNNDFTDEGYIISKFSQNISFYDWHYDVNKDRGLTAIWFLSDDSDFSVEFFNGIKIQAQKGKFVMFPVSWSFVYKINKPTNNDCFILQTWLTKE